MTTRILDKSETLALNELQKEVGLLRSFVIGQAGRDPEGNYKPDFVRKILKASANNQVEHVFKDRKSFLDYLNADKN